MGHPYRQRHTQPESTTSDKLTGAQAKQVKKSTSTAKGKRSSK